MTNQNILLPADIIEMFFFIAQTDEMVRDCGSDISSGCLSTVSIGCCSPWPDQADRR